MDRRSFLKWSGAALAGLARVVSSRGGESPARAPEAPNFRAVSESAERAAESLSGAAEAAGDLADSVGTFRQLVVRSGVPDHDGDIFAPGCWDLSAFEESRPPLLLNYDFGRPIGELLETKETADGLVATYKVRDPEILSFLEKGVSLKPAAASAIVDAEVLAETTAGHTKRIEKAELLAVSLCTVPANRSLLRGNDSLGIKTGRPA